MLHICVDIIYFVFIVVCMYIQCKCLSFVLVPQESILSTLKLFSATFYSPFI